MKVENMTNSNGNKVANQFIVHGAEIRFTFDGVSKHHYGELFQSYDSNIALIEERTRVVFLDETYWDYGTTTGRFRNMFLGETKKETEAKIKTGEYKIVNLN